MKEIKPLLMPTIWISLGFYLGIMSCDSLTTNVTQSEAVSKKFAFFDDEGEFCWNLFVQTIENQHAAN